MTAKIIPKKPITYCEAITLRVLSFCSARFSEDAMVAVVPIGGRVLVSVTWVCFFAIVIMTILVQSIS